MNQNPQQTHAILDSYESTENALMDSFKAAALKVTTLYKDSLVQNRKAYASGYQQALQDLYEFISSHPSTTVSQGEMLTPPMEHGYLPVQDLLAYARQRNAQLNSEMGLPIDQLQQTTSSPSSSSVPTNTSTSFDPSCRSQGLSQFSNNNNNNNNNYPSTMDPNSQTSTTGNHTSNNSDSNNINNNNHSNNNNTIINPNSPVITVNSGPAAAAVVKNAFHPFQIDPNTQFTFSLPVNYHPHAWYNNNINHHHHDMENDMDNNSNHHHGMNGNGDNINNSNNNSGFMLSDNAMDGLKRRMTPNELTFMGRQLNNMNIDNWNEPPVKRRLKRED